MSKIVLGYERFSKNSEPLWNFNGRCVPNSKIYPEDVMEPFNITMKSWFTEIVTPEKLSSDVSTLQYLFGYVNNNKMHEYKLVSEIEPGTQYFYPINVLSMWLYSNYVSEISISKKVHEDALNGNAYIIFIYTTEGDIINFQDKFRELVSKLGLPKEQIYLLHGDLETARYINEPYMYVPIHEMHWWLHHIDATNDFADETKIEKLFLCYNRTLRPHKLLLLAQLVNANLIDSGVLSAGKFGRGTLEHVLLSNNLRMDDQRKELFYSLSNTSPDDKKFPLDNPAQQTVVDHYNKTFLSLTVETLEIPLFFSEKTYKPILHKHPFILVGAQGMLKKLKEFGFRTFNQWWDESYDDAINMQDRIQKIIEILSKLNHLDIDTLKLYRRQMQDTLEHNYQTLQAMFDNKDYHTYTEVYKALCVISDTHKGKLNV